MGVIESERLPARELEPHGGMHLPGLDGLRGIAVAAVVAFHLWPAVVPGGFLGVSLFFTLSGYLIVGRLDGERSRTGTIDVRAFWARRVRRLLPASLLTLFAITVIWHAAGWMTRDIGAATVAALAQLANWFQIAHHDVYGVDAESSPVVHFWSLAIEEQAYLVLPLVAFVCRRRRQLVGALAVLLAGSVLATYLAAGDATVVYYSTFTRAGEILVGALAAVLLRGWRPRRQILVGLAGVGGLVALAWAVGWTSLSTGAYYRGGLLLIGAGSTVVVVCVARSTQLGRCLAWTPLAFLGQISYGVYLFHWPALVGLRELGLGGWRLGPGVILLTLAAAVLSRRLLEEPVRRRTLRLGAAVQVAVGAALATVVVTGTLVAPQHSSASDFAEAAATLDARLDAVPPPPPSAAPRSSSHVQAAATEPSTPVPSMLPMPMASTPVAPPPPLRIGMFGDSKALNLALGMVPTGGPVAQVVAAPVEMGCALGRGGTHRADRPGDAVAVDTELCDWTQGWPAGLAGRTPIDVGIVWFGSWDAQDRRGAPLGDGWSHLGQPAFDAWMLTELDAASQLLLTHGVRTVVWLTVDADPATESVGIDRYNELLETYAAGHGPQVQVIDLAAWLDATGERDRLLPDGRHATFEPDGGTAREIGDRFLVGQIVQAAARNP
jgi:peptidoglycan/LPS O-acetylase OafA/YrhL